MTLRRLDTALLADLDAGLLDPRRTEAAKAAAAADPHARAVLDALAATRAQLAALDDPPVPPALADRWTAAIQAELRAAISPSALDPAGPVDLSGSPARPGQADGRPTSLSAPTDASAEPPSGSRVPLRAPESPPRGVDPRRARLHPPHKAGPPRGPARLRPFRGRPRRALAVVLVLSVLVGAGWLVTRSEAAPPLVVERPQLVALGTATIGVQDAGGLDDPVRRAACLLAVAPPGVDPAAPLLGARHVVFAGEPGVLLVLGAGRRGTFDVVIVDPACGAAGGTRLAAVRVGPP